MPLLAVVCVLVSGIEGPLMIGIIVVGCVPGAMASNVLTLNAKGNPSYSVSLTATATLISPLAVPLALGTIAWLLGDPSEGEELSKLANRAIYWKSAQALLYRVVCPVIVGHLLGRIFHRWEKQAQKIFPEIANLAILLIIAAVVAKNRENLDHLPVIIFCLLLVLNLGGYLSGYFGGSLMRLPEPMKRALTLEVGMQNAGLGTVLAADLFGAEAAIAPACYTFGCMLTGTVLARYWSTRVTETASEDETYQPRPHLFSFFSYYPWTATATFNCIGCLHLAVATLMLLDRYLNSMEFAHNFLAPIHNANFIFWFYASGLLLFGVAALLNALRKNNER